MKNSISNVWLLGLVVLFILIFSGYLAVTINYSKAFKVKNQLLTMIEKQKCVINKKGDFRDSIITNGQVIGDTGSLQTMCLYLYGYGYKTMGHCGDDLYPSTTTGWVGVYDFGISSSYTANLSPKYDLVISPSKTYYFCILKVDDSKKDSTTGRVVANGYYYYIQLFYKMDLPVFGDIFTFSVAGNTAKIYGNNNCDSTIVYG